MQTLERSTGDPATDAVRAQLRRPVLPFGRRMGAWPAAVTAGALVSFLVTVGPLLTVPGRELLARYMADDAFYYFDIARRFPHMGTAPGVTTSGFHPLYWAVLVLLFHVVHGIGAVRMSLVLLLAAHMAAGGTLFILLRRQWRESVAGVIAIFWMASAVTRAVVLLGLETALVEVTVLGLLLVCDPARRPDRRRQLLAGMLLGLAYLARNDSVIICLPVAGAWMWAHRRALPGVRSALPLILAAAALAAPWAAFLLAHGSLLTDSARALPTLAGRQGPGGGVALWVLQSTLWLLMSPFSNHVGGGSITAVASGSVVLVGLSLWCRRHRWTPSERAIAVSVPVLFLLYMIVLKGIRTWYFVYLAIWLFVVILPPLGERVATMLSRATFGPTVLAAAGLALVVTLLAARPASVYPAEGDKYQAATAAQQILPPRADVASFNSGIYQFVLASHVVVNLDGVVNPDVRPYIAGHSLCRFLAAGHTTWFLDSNRGFADMATEPGVRIRSLRTLVSHGAGGRGQFLARLDTTGCGGLAVGSAPDVTSATR